MSNTLQKKIRKEAIKMAEDFREQDYSYRQIAKLLEVEGFNRSHEWVRQVLNEKED